MYRRVLFIGSKASGFNVLKKMYDLSPESLVGCVTVDDSTDSRSQLNSIVEYCCEKAIEIDILEGKCDLTSSIRKFSPDLCVVMGWYYIISENLLTEVKGGFIGIHNSLLPRHRGFSPVVWSIIAGDKETGFSVFSFDKGMDTGDIWFQGKVEIKRTDYIEDILLKIDSGVSDFFDTTYLDILAERIKPVAQIEENVSYGARRTPEDGKIDWNKDANEIYDFIRAQSKPYPGAYTSYKGEVMTIWRSEVFPYPIHGFPGQIGLIDSDKNAVVIVCGNNTGLVISDVCINGSISSVRKYVKGLNYRFI